MLITAENNYLDDTEDVHTGLIFHLTPINSDIYGKVNVRGIIPLLLTKGKYKTPEILNNPSQLASTVKQLVANYRDLWPNESDEDIEIKCRDYLLLGLFANPTIEANQLNSLPIQAYILHILLFFAIDDILDPLDEHSELNLKYKDIKSYCAFFEKLFSGVYKSKGDMISTIKALEPTNEFCLKFIQMSSECIPEFFEKNQYLKHNWLNGLKAWVLLMEPNAQCYSSRSMSILGSHIAGTYAPLEFVALTRNITLPETIRKDILFQRVLEAYAVSLHLVNDLLGLEKDVRLGLVRDSSILRRVKDNQSLSLQKAFDEAQEQLIIEVEDIRLLCAVLRETYVDTAGVNDYLDCLQMAFDGMCYWYGRTSRYGNLRLEVLTYDLH